MVEVRAHGFLAVFAVCGLYDKGRAPSPIVHFLSVAGKLAQVSKRRRAFVALISYGAHRRAVCVCALRFRDGHLDSVCFFLCL